MRDAVESAAKEARAVFTKAMNAAVEEAVSKVKAELRRKKDSEEAARVAKDDDYRRRSQEEKLNSSSVQSSVADKILSVAVDKANGEGLRSSEETIASVTAEKYREMEEAVVRTIT